MKKLLLVQPTTESTLDFVNYSSAVLETLYNFLPESRIKNSLRGKKAVNIPSLSLMILSALTPRDQFEVEFVDEKIETINYNSGADLVAITANTTIASRAYEIAKEFRKRGAKIAMGGMHASVLPDEVLQHADAVAIGEAEYIWPKMLEDFLEGKLQGKYRAERFLDMKKDFVIPNNSILKKEHYLFDTALEISRGCPHHCNFCSCPNIYGPEYRMREIDQVIAQVEQAESKLIHFVDDNIVGNPAYAKKLFKELKKLNIRWVSDASMLLSKDKELMDLAIESGCRFLVVGLESTSEAELKHLNKKQNLGLDYGAFVRYMQDGGVLIAASFILGFDNDSVQSIKEQHQYARDQGILFYMPGVLTPYPGTPLFNEFEEEGRLLHKDWSKYNVRSGVPVFSGSNHTEEYLRDLEVAVKTNGIYYFLRQLQEQPELIKRFVD